MAVVPHDLKVHSAAPLPGRLMIVENEQVLRIDCWRPRDIALIVGAGLLELPLIAAAIFLLSHEQTAAAIILFVLGPVLAGGGILLMLLTRGVKPWLRYQKKARRLLIPRWNIALGLDELSHLRVVEESDPHRPGAVKVELQAVPRTRIGGMEVVPIVTGLSTRQLQRIAKQVAAPMFRVTVDRAGHVAVADLRTGAEMTLEDYQRVQDERRRGSPSGAHSLA